VPSSRADFKAVLLFFALTYAVTWASFFGAATLSTQSWFVSPLLYVGTFAPSFVALGLTARETGLPGIRTLLRRVVDFHASWRWFVFAVGYIATLKLLTAVTYRLATASWPAFGTTPLVVIPFAILISTPVQAGEEIGWRGYALPRLAERFGFPRASLLLGLLWGAWHLPLFFIPGHPNHGQPLLFFVLGSTGLSVAMTWLYMNTRGSVGFAMLMHSAVNQTMGIVPTRLASAGNPLAIANVSPIMWLFIALLWSMAAYFLLRMRRRQTSVGAMSPITAAIQE